MKTSTSHAFVTWILLVLAFTLGSLAVELAGVL